MRERTRMCHGPRGVRYLTGVAQGWPCSTTPDVDSPPARAFLGEGRVTMAKYMLLLGGADLDKRSGNASLAPVMFQRYASWLSSLRESGRYVSSHKLHDQTGARLTVRGGQVVEGPF